MDILLATQSLSGFGGSESYVVTVADHLQRLGHDVRLLALDRGASAEAAERLGLRVVGPDRLPPPPDVVVAQDAVVAYELADAYPQTPQAFVVHSDIFDLQLPPMIPEVAALVVALYDRVERRARATSAAPPILRLTQPVDVERFKPTAPLRSASPVALTLGNYVHGERLALIRRACERAGIELRHVGEHAGRTTSSPQEAYNGADIVFGKARVICEAMACGRAAYVLDHNGGEGWVTAANRTALAADNFGGQSDPITIDEHRLVADLERYDPGMGLVNRDYVVAHHGATKHAARLEEALRALAPRPAGALDGVPLRELARLVRLHHRADADGFQLRAQLERVSAQLHEARADAHRARQDADERAVELAAAHARANDAERERELGWADAARHADAAERAWREFDAVVATRRWRALTTALRPLDRLRRR